MLNPQHYKTRTQDLKKYYYDAEAILFLQIGNCKKSDSFI